MLKITQFLLLSIIAIILFFYCAKTDNAEPDNINTPNIKFKPGEIWNDVAGLPINAHGGGILYQDGIYYWYGEIKTGKTWAPESNKSWEGTRVRMTGISCYSSKDLLNWKNEGIVLSAIKDDVKHDLHINKVVERPKVIFNKKTQKYVMWMHIDSEDYSYARAGVAISDKPTGWFTYLGSLRPNDQMSRDMTLFVDDDGQAYHFYSSEDNQTLYISLLSDDYLKPSGTYKRVFIGRYMEAPAIFKHNDKYYFMASGCTGWDPNAARSAVAPSIWGPWQELGNPCKGENADVTFYSQSTYILPVVNKENAFIYMGDRWSKHNLPNSGYVWLPIILTENGFEIQWIDEWDLTVF